MDNLDLEFVKAFGPDGKEERILLANVAGETVGNFRLIGKHHADLAFRYYKDGPQEVRFPMTDRWPTVGEARDIINKYTKEEPQWGGDLFTTNCEEDRHAWRVDWEAEGHPIACKWCDKPRYEYDDDMNDFEEN